MFLRAWGLLLDLIRLLFKSEEEIRTPNPLLLSFHLLTDYFFLLVIEELDESMAELEECRRKLVSLMMQKDVTIAMHVPTLGVVNGNLSPEKPAERTIGFRELKDSIEETKV